MSSKSSRLLLTLSVGVVAALACHQQSSVRRVLPGVSTGNFSELSESSLNSIVICHDTLGRPMTPDRSVVVTRCTPCVPYGMQASLDRSLEHARQLWTQGARAPYDTNDIGARCARLAYSYARQHRPDDDALAVEIALMELTAAEDATRAGALARVDSLVGGQLNHGYTERAAAIVGQLGHGMWDRAQRQLERPDGIRRAEVERDAHNLAKGAPQMAYLPLLPVTSRALGVSEALWAARLFNQAAAWTEPGPRRAQYRRLALAPWVVLSDWIGLDSAAQAMLQREPRDSIARSARALAAYRRMTQPVLESPAVSALFDSALAAMPRVDSARYDSFDDVLSDTDEEWRYQLLPDRRIALDQRGWAVIDPMWSTPVNEIRLARRARMADADFRYADLTAAAQSGSETEPGQMLLRRGAPLQRWEVTSSENRRYRLMRGWKGLLAISDIAQGTSGKEFDWRPFYGPWFSAGYAAGFETTDPCTSKTDPFHTLYLCALNTPADWTDVPLYGKTDFIDVIVARFRAPGDSVDMYVGSRVPLRGFRSRDDVRAQPSDRITMGFWLTNELGESIIHDSVTRALPPQNLLAWTQQWTARVGTSRMMHRVEAIEPTMPSGARGVARFTSDAQASFPVRGFGMSEVLIAESATPGPRPARRWSDLVIQPNGGTVAPEAPFSMVWEVYGLAPDANGRTRWRVRIKREQGAVVIRSDMKDVLSGAATAGSRVLPNESTAPDLSYTREGGSEGVMLENIRFGLGNAPEGYHVVNVTVDDLVSGKSVTRGVSIRVLKPSSQRRGTGFGMSTLAMHQGSVTVREGARSSPLAQ